MLQEIVLWSCWPWFWFEGQQECVGSHFLYLSDPSVIRDTFLTRCTAPKWWQTEIGRGCGTAVIVFLPQSWKNFPSSNAHSPVGCHTLLEHSLRWTTAVYSVTSFPHTSGGCTFCLRDAVTQVHCADLRNVPTGSHIWTVGPKLMVLFKKVMGSWRDRILLEEVCHWGLASGLYGLALLPLPITMWSASYIPGWHHAPASMTPQCDHVFPP